MSQSATTGAPRAPLRTLAVTALLDGIGHPSTSQETYVDAVGALLR